jgi:hypothetical protein
VLRRLTTGLLSKLLTSFSQPTKWKRNRCLGVGVSDVGKYLYPSLNGHLHYPNDKDRSLNEATVDKIRKYHTDYTNNPPNSISFIPGIPSTSGRLHSEFVLLLFWQTHREADRFFQFQQFKLRNMTVDCSTSDVWCSPHISSLKWSSPSSRLQLYKSILTIYVNLNLDGTPITSKSHTHPSHSQTSLLLTSSLSLGETRKVFQSPTQPSVYETCRSLSFRF